MDSTDSVTGGAKFTSPLPRKVQAAKYDRTRSLLLDELRAELGGPYRENQSLVVMDALDLLLKERGKLPADAPLLSSLTLAGEEDGGTNG